MPTPEPPILDYGTPPPSPTAAAVTRWWLRFNDLASRCPTWVLAMVLVLLTGIAVGWLPVWPKPWNQVYHWLLVTPLFLAGAVKRRNGAHLIMLLAASALLYVAYYGIASATGAIRPPYPHVAVECLLIGGFLCCELWLVGRLHTVRPGALIGTTIAAAMLVVLAWNGVLLTRSFDYKPPGLPHLFELVMPVVRPLVVLMVVPALLRDRPMTGRFARVRWVAVAGLAAVFILSFEVALVRLARHSTRGDGLLDRLSAGQTLWVRGRADDWRYLTAALASADWNVRTPDPRDPSSDWRWHYIRVLENWRPQPAMDGIAQALLANPSEQYAAWAAAGLARHERFDCAPILMRYALWDDDEACLDALYTMSTLLIAQAVIAREAALDEPMIHPEMRKYLADVLGTDAGAANADWTRWIGDRLSGSEVPASVRAENGRLVELYQRWYRAATKHFPPGQPVPSMNLNAPTLDELEREVDRWILQAQRNAGGAGMDR